MQDYLNQLVNRNQQLGSVVQPRPLSRFEMLQDSIFAAPDSLENSLDTFESATAEESSRSETPIYQSDSSKIDEYLSFQPVKSNNPDQHRNVVTARSDILVAIDGKTEFPTSRDPIDSPQEQPSNLVQRTTKLGGNEFPVTNKPATEKQVLSNSIERVIQQKILIQPATTFEVAQNIENSQEKKSLLDLSQPTKSRVQPQTNSEVLTEKPLFEWKLAESPKLDVSSESRRNIIKPLIESVTSQKTTNPVVDTPEPTIHITIGRIEVRATAAATAVKRAPAKSSAMSLDDYLKQRQTGGRA